MFSLLFTLGFLTGPAQTPQPAPVSLQSEVRQALRRSALAGFVGTVSFQKEMWSPPSLHGDQYVLQFWKIATDGEGRLHAELSWPNRDNSSRLMVCETPTLMWMTGLNNQLVVLDKLNPPDPTLENEAGLSFVQSLAHQAEVEIQELLESPASRHSVLDILLLNRSPECTEAVVKIDDKLRQVTFRRVDDGTLLLASITRDKGGTTYRYEFKDHYQFGERWIPRTIEFEQHHALRGTIRVLYSQIELVGGQPNAPDFEKCFVLPEPGDPAKTGIVVARVFSRAFEGGVKVEATFFPQLDAMRGTRK